MKKKRINILCLLLVVLLSTLGYGIGEAEVITILSPEEGHEYWNAGIEYCRVVELRYSAEYKGMLVATCEVLDEGLSDALPGYPIFRSDDAGKTWKELTVIREKAKQVNSIWMPQLYELPTDIGDMPAGTLLCAACSADPKHSQITSLRIYRSFDAGETWEQYTYVVTGRGQVTYRGVYEPYLMVLPDGRLACYYADETDDKHSQKISLAISSNGVEFDEFHDICAMEQTDLRPGMPVVAQMNDGRYIMAYEMVTLNNPDTGNPIYCKYSDDGINWGNTNDPGFKIVTDEGYVPGSTPYIVNVPGYGENGLLIVTASFQTPSRPGRYKTYLYVNDNYGEGIWKAIEHPLKYRRGGYSQGMDVASDGITVHFAGNIEEQGSKYTRFAYTFQDMTEYFNGIF